MAVTEQVRGRGAVQQDVVWLVLAFRVGGHEDLAYLTPAKVTEGAGIVGGLRRGPGLRLGSVSATVGAVLFVVAWMSVITAGVEGVWCAVAIARLLLDV